MSTLLRNAHIVTPDEEISSGSVLIEGQRIAGVGAELAPPDGARTLDLGGLTLAPGFIDLHVHGGGGLSLMTPDPSEAQAYSAWVPATGVTSFLATICASGLEEGLRFIRAAVKAAGNPSGASLLGINLEGPFVNSARRGALPPSWPLPPDQRSFDGIAQAAQGRLAVMTVAPELAGADALIRTAVARGIRVSVGHTDAPYQTARRAFDAGASQVTHAFNAMRPFHHREPGPVAAALDSPGVILEVIADGEHLHPSVVGLLARAFGPERVALVTDGVAPAGLAAGALRIGKEVAQLRGRRVELPDGTLAGGASTMDALVRNVVRWGCASLAEAVRMAASTPAAALGLDRRKGRIAPGYDADLVALDADLTPVMTWVMGQLVFSAR